MYIDIRDEKGFSYNYHRNCSNNIRIDNTIYDEYQNTRLGDADNKTYETDGWPILILGEAFFTSEICTGKKKVSMQISFATTKDMLLYSANSETYYDEKFRNRRKRHFESVKKIYELGKREEENWSHEHVLASRIIQNKSVSTFQKLMVAEKEVDTVCLSNLFEIKPFADYDYWYSDKSTQYWLTSHESFLNEEIDYSVVNTGVALDYKKNRITFFAIPFTKGNQICFNNEKSIINGFGQSYEQSFYATYGTKKDKSFVKTIRRISSNPLEQVFLLRNISTNGNDDGLYSISMTKEEYEEKIESRILYYDLNYPIFLQLVDICECEEDDSSLLKESFYSLNVKLNGIVKQEYPDFDSNTLINLKVYTTDMHTFSTNNAAIQEDVIETNAEIRGFVFQNSGYDYSAEGKNNEEEYEKERKELKLALDYIKLLNAPLYNQVQKKMYEEFKKKESKQYPCIIIRYEDFSQTSYENITSYTKTILKSNNVNYQLKSEDIKDYILKNCESTGCYLNEEWRPQIICTQNGEEKIVDIKSKTEKITINNNELDIFFNIDIRLFGKDQYCSAEDVKYEIPILLKQIFIENYNARNFTLVHILAHEFGHCLSNMENTFEEFIWTNLESVVGELPANGDYLNFKNSSGRKGHLMGMIGGINACKNDYKTCQKFFEHFTILWGKKLSKNQTSIGKIKNEDLNIDVYPENVIPGMNEWYENYLTYCQTTKYSD